MKHLLIAVLFYGFTQSVYGYYEEFFKKQYIFSIANLEGYPKSIKQTIYNTKGDSSVKKFDLTYNAKKKIEKLTEDDAFKTIYAFTYDALGRLVSIKYSDNSIYNWSFDTYGMLTAYTLKLKGWDGVFSTYIDSYNRTITRDAQNRVTKIEKSRYNGSSYVYASSEKYFYNESGGLDSVEYWEKNTTLGGINQLSKTQYNIKMPENDFTNVDNLSEKFTSYTQNYIGYIRNITKTYDDKGNVLKITQFSNEGAFVDEIENIYQDGKLTKSIFYDGRYLKTESTYDDHSKLISKDYYSRGWLVDDLPWEKSLNSGEVITRTYNDNVPVFELFEEYSGNILVKKDKLEYSYSINQVPAISAIPAQTIFVGESFKPLYLNDYVADETPDNEIMWKAETANNFTITIANNIATIKPKNTSWMGMETIVLTATDKQGLSSKINVKMSVVENKAPVLGIIAPQTITQGSSFTKINLNTVVSDETDDKLIKWTSTKSSNISISITWGYAEISVINADWKGTETVTFTATDHLGLTSQATTSFTVTAPIVNKAPLLSPIPAQTVSQGSAFATVKLDNYVTDETADVEIVWTASTTTNLTVTIVKNEATIAVKNINWNGSESVIFTAKDKGGLSTETTATFTIKKSIVQAEAIEEKTELYLYPNPCSNVLHLYNVSQEVSIEVYGVDGINYAIPKNISENVAELDVSNLSPAEYLVVIQSKKGTSQLPFIKK